MKIYIKEKKEKNFLFEIPLNVPPPTEEQLKELEEINSTQDEIIHIYLITLFIDHIQSLPTEEQLKVLATIFKLVNNGRMYKAVIEGDKKKIEKYTTTDKLHLYLLKHTIVEKE